MTNKNLIEVENCKYRLPCGWCDRKNETCKFYTTPNFNESEKLTEACDHYWECTGVDTKYWHYTCKWCGEHKREKIYQPDSITAFQPDTVWEGIPEACKHCSNHPSDGGSGICNCTLGLPKVTCGTMVGTSGNITLNKTIYDKSYATDNASTLSTNVTSNNWTVAGGESNE